VTTATSPTFPAASVASAWKVREPTESAVYVVAEVREANAARGFARRRARGFGAVMVVSGASVSATLQL
jgi:hypothetical protein